ncbi:hypothetical protein HMPREF9488_00054 [Coprobacillus cateniformis]|uniref:Uncharacterized protein n=1 Tax=Coprobacillus cateniformis TaxID=100884 RepID=E7G5L6_9FIRM|nr:hypothetical protein [Coprobacillus cateniformis]EFW06517.1 hypothetical protein HMPREF9488_00054 [Coprobacillus cateniformis]
MINSFFIVDTIVLKSNRNNKHLISTFKWKCLEDSICQFPNHVEIGLVVMLDEKA